MRRGLNSRLLPRSSREVSIGLTLNRTDTGGDVCRTGRVAAHLDQEVYVTYIHQFDRSTIIEIAPQCYLNETAERALRLHHTSVTGLKHHEDKHDDDPIGPIERVTQMAKQFSDSTKHSNISAESTNSVDCSSLIPLRDRLVGPDVPASSPSHGGSSSMLFRSCLVGRFWPAAPARS